MEPNESHHHHLQQQHQQQLQQQQPQRLSSPFYHHHHQQQLQHHHPTTVATTVSSSNNALFPPPQQPNDVSSSLAVYPHSVPSSAVSTPMEPLKRKRGRPRKYVTAEQALAAKKMASSASSSSAKQRKEQAAAAGGTASSNSKSSKKSQLGSVGKSGQSFTPHIVNIAPGEDVALKIRNFANQSKQELCVLSASGTICNASLGQPATSGSNISYEGQYEIISLSGSFIRAEAGGKTGGLSVSLSSTDGQIIGGAIGTHLTAAGPVQVILGTFLLDRKKDTTSGKKGDASNSGSQLTSLPSTEPMLGMGFRPGMESSSGRNQMRGNNEHHHHQQTGLGGSHHFMMQTPPGMHMAQPRPSEWGGGGNRGHDGRGGGGYDLSGRIGHESSENGDYEPQMPD